MTKALATRTSLKKSDPDDLFKAVAMDIGKQVAAHVEVMYPEAVKASSSMFLLSLRNTVFNEIMGVMSADPNENTSDRLQRRAQWRRQWKAMYKKMREL